MSKVLEMADVDRLKKVGRYLLEYAGYIIIFFLLVGIYCYVRDRRMFWNIFPPAGQWNDEVFYYKQIESMIKYGFPRGYFGYNESHAQMLTFGPWNLFLLLPYVIVGKVLGWNYFMPVLVNILMFASAIFIFAKVSGATVKERILIYCIYGAFGIIFRYILSGMVESIAFSICLVIISLVYKLERNFINKKIQPVVWVILFLCFIATVMRPYFIILFSYPLYFSIVRKKREEIIGTSVLAIMGMLVYFGVNKYLCAPYFTPIIDLSFIDVIRENGLLAGVYDIVSRFGNGMRQIKGFLFNMIADGQSVLTGKIYLFFLLEMVFLIFLFIKGIKTKQVRPAQAIRVITIGVFFAMLVAVVIFYHAGVGVRHLLICLIIGTIVLILGEGENKKFSYTVVITMCIVGLLFEYDDNIKDIPYKTIEWNSVIAESEEVLHKCIDIDLDVVDYWDNTVAYEPGVPYNDLYGMPAGVGIQFDFDDYLLDAGEPVSSRYLMVVPGGELSRCLTGLNAELLGSTERFEVFLNPGVPLYRIE